MSSQKILQSINHLFCQKKIIIIKSSKTKHTRTGQDRTAKQLPFEEYTNDNAILTSTNCKLINNKKF